MCFHTPLLAFLFDVLGVAMDLSRGLGYVAGVSVPLCTAFDNIDV